MKKNRPTPKRDKVRAAAKAARRASRAGLAAPAAPLPR